MQNQPIQTTEGSFSNQGCCICGCFYEPLCPVSLCRACSSAFIIYTFVQKQMVMIFMNSSRADWLFKPALAVGRPTPSAVAKLGTRPVQKYLISLLRFESLGFLPCSIFSFPLLLFETVSSSLLSPFTLLLLTCKPFDLLKKI